MSQYAFYFDGTRCTGCKTCEFACKDFNDLGLGITFRKILEATLGDTTRDAEGIISSNCVSYTVSLACNHCDKPACMAECSQGAISKDSDTGFVVIDETACIGCGACALACPYGAPVVDEKTKKALKCHGCADRVAIGLKPVCVEACPARALDFGLVEDMEKRGERANIAPLPDVSITAPHLYIKPSVDARVSGSKDGRAVNILEVR